MTHYQAVVGQLARLAAFVHDVHDHGHYEVGGKYETWQSNKLKELVSESEILVANSPDPPITRAS